MDTLVVAAEGCVGAREVRETLEEEGYRVVVATPGGGSVEGRDGETVEADIALGDADEGSGDDGYGAIVVTGGATYEAVDAEAVETVRRFAERGAFVCSVGEGILALADAGLLDSRLVAEVEGTEDSVREAGGVPMDEDVMVDAKFLTSREGADGAEGLAEELHRKLRRARLKGL